MSWTETGKLRLADFDMLMAVGNEIEQSQTPPAPAGRNGVTRTPIT